MNRHNHQVRLAVIVMMIRAGPVNSGCCRVWDEGSDTLGHTATAVGGLKLPTWTRWSGNLHGNIVGVPGADFPTMAYGHHRASAGKDSTTATGNRGIITTEPQATFTGTAFRRTSRGGSE